MNRARRNYARLWNRVAPLYGQRGKKAPKFSPVPKGGGDAYVTYSNTGPDRAVNLAPQERRQLKRNPNNAQFTLLHEWGHVFGAGSEGHANRVANLATRQLRGKTPRKVVRRRIRNTLNIQDG